jgi:hypothetical protein
MLRLYLEACGKLGARVVIERLRRLALDLNGKFGCEVCGAKWPAMFPFMVDDQLWEAVSGDEDAPLCLSCFESKMLSKIGRGLVASDFGSAPINDAILFGIRIAMRGRPSGN